MNHSISCYFSNNRYAYNYDIGDSKRIGEETKIYNFVPTYDKWCLYCNKKGVELRCSKCKAIYFCNQECQIKAWPIHKKHCDRDLFQVCAGCGIGLTLMKIQCGKCPVKYCSEECKNRLHSAHIEFDCEHFQRMFKK